MPLSLAFSAPQGKQTRLAVSRERGIYDKEYGTGRMAASKLAASASVHRGRTAVGAGGAGPMELPQVDLPVEGDADDEGMELDGKSVEAGVSVEAGITFSPGGTRQFVMPRVVFLYI